MILSCSNIQAYATCQRKWFNRYILGWQGPSSQALDDGTTWHLICAGERPVLPGDPIWMREGYAEFLKEEAEWGWETLDREIELSVELGTHRLLGKPDAIVRWNGMLWHMQHKSCRSSLSVGHYSKLIARSWHEALYAHLIQARYPGEPYGGTILVLARKLTKPPFCYVQPLAIPNVDKTLEHLLAYADEMETRAGACADHGCGGNLHENRDACMGTWGNQPCWFLPVCNGETDFRGAGLEQGDPMKRYSQEVRFK